MEKIKIKNSEANQRIDKFLSKEFFSFTRGEIIREIKKNNISIDGKNIKPSYILKENDEIKIKFGKKSENLISNKNIKLEIIYNDENIIAIDKPAGIPVHPVNLDEVNTLANGLIYHFPEIKKVGDNSKIRPGIVHRLDKNTSGVMVLARNKKAYEELKRKFKEREIEKKYLAIVYGKLNKKEGIVEKSIARSSNYKKQVIAGGKTKTKIRPAVTKYKVILEMENYSLVELEPKTGRMHQIRVHMKYIGHPILGDKVYKLKRVQTLMMAKRQILHAQGIKFSLFGHEYNFFAEIPEDFKKVLDFLTKSGEKATIN
jgi:23S rRNA pseudouridine1911/1915/1917 synthase